MPHNGPYVTLAEVIRQTADAVRNGPLDWRRAADSEPAPGSKTDPNPAA